MCTLLLCVVCVIYIYIYTMPHRETPPPEIRSNTSNQYNMQWISSVLCVVSKCLHLIHPTSNNSTGGGGLWVGFVWSRLPLSTSATVADSSHLTNEHNKVCVCIYIYIYIYTHTRIWRPPRGLQAEAAWSWTSGPPATRRTSRGALGGTTRLTLLV